MSFNKKEQDRLEAALANRALKEKLLDEFQAMRKAYNDLLAKLDSDTGVTDTDYTSTLTVENVRANNKKEIL
jgi:hypothetical protein